MPTIQDLEEIRSDLRSGTITKAEALQKVGVVMAAAKSKALKKKCEDMINEIIEMSEEPVEMTSAERAAVEQHYEAKQSE
jgi:hypothetical protein